MLEAKNIATNLLKNEIQTIIFTRTRLSCEVMVTYLKEAVAKKLKGKGRIRGYRGGYLPKERRAIEKGLREGEVMGVVSTNALELGIDIGQLKASVMTGYPGTISSTWQQSGRAGRRSVTSSVFLVCSDSFLIKTPVGAALEFDPLWFGIMICVNLQMCFMTPSFAAGIFICRGACAPEFGVSMGDIIRGVIPFVILVMVALTLFVLFPEIILWLPGQMIK